MKKFRVFFLDFLLLVSEMSAFLYIIQTEMLIQSKFRCVSECYHIPSQHSRCTEKNQGN